MTPRKGADNDTMEVKIARMDERIEHMHAQFPELIKQVDAHSRDILTAKIIGIGILVVVAIKFPQIAEAVARAFP